MSQQRERTVLTTGPLPARTPKGLAAALRIVDAGPRLVGRAVLASLTATCILSTAVSLSVRPAGPLPYSQAETIDISLAGLFVVGLLMLATAIIPAPRRAVLLDRVVPAGLRAAIWLALTVWFPFLVIVAYYRASATLPLTQHWIAFGYTDKRWITAAYLLGVLAPMPLLVGATRVLEAGRAHPDSWRSWLRDLAPRRRPAAPATSAEENLSGVVSQSREAAPSREAGAAAKSLGGLGGSRFVRVTAGLLTALGLAYYFYGPPWYLNRAFGSLSIGYQEDLYLGNMQAISKGAIPYIGPAANQYGPGAELFSYLFMRHVGTFSVVGFRESWAMFEWVGASLLFVVFFLAFGYFRGLIAAVMSALIYPALQLMGFVPGGAYSGFFGWANPLRYAGAISLVLLLPAVIRRAPAWRGLAGAAVLGLLWGGLSYVAQENLLAGAAGALVIGALLLLSGTSSWRSVISSLLAVLAGFAVSWLPVLAYYAVKGVLGRFLYLYFFIPRAVAEGYSNTPYGGKDPFPYEITMNAPWAHMYYTLPFVLAVLAVLAVVRFRPLRIAMEWSRDRIMLVAVVLTTILMYQGALLRSDSDHIAGTMLVVPALVVTVATVLPRLLGGLQRGRLVLAGVVIFVASFLLLPFHAYEPSSIGGQAEAPLLDRQHLADMRVPRTPSTVAGQRVGAGLSGRRACCQAHPERMGSFIKLANRLHAEIGTRTTYVAGFKAGYPGLLYFVADLRPAPVPLDLRTMVLTQQQNLAFLANFRANVVPKTQAVVSTELTVGEVRAFLSRYPHAKVDTLYYKGLPLYVLLGPR